MKIGPFIFLEIVILLFFIIFPSERLDRMIKLLVYPLAKENGGLYKVFNWIWSSTYKNTFIKVLCALLLLLDVVRVIYFFMHYKILTN